MASEQKHYIAVDLGAESGRVMLGTVSAEQLTLREVRRFANTPLEDEGSLRWNFPELFEEIKRGLSEAIAEAEGDVCGIGVDSWGVDFGLLDENGELLENPYHYRDRRSNGMLEKAFELMDKRAIYENSGLQFMQINSLYQLLSMRLADSPILAKAKKLLFMAYLVSYYLGARCYAEYTLASTSQFMDMRSGQFSTAILKALELPAHILPEIVNPGTIVGKLKPEICRELHCKPIDIIAVGSHDTASAVLAVPARKQPWAYISSGTWSLVGVETPGAIINDKTFKHSFTNEGGVDNTIRLLKNLMGLWLLQECRGQWQREGSDLSYEKLTILAGQANPFRAQIDPDCVDFLAPGNMPGKINGYLVRTSQQTIEDKGQLVRVILESLAFRYRQVIEALEDITGQGIKVLHIVGGGSKNELLAQFAANAIGKKILTGPAEATACGNVLMQSRACGQLHSLRQARELIGKSFELKQFLPRDIEIWSEHYQKFLKMTS